MGYVSKNIVLWTVVLSAIIEEMTATLSIAFRVFASKPFMRFARRFGISDEDLWNAVTGPWDADLGGNVFKYRLARVGEGTSGGARALIAMKVGRRAVLMFGFEKKDMAGIKPDELKGFRKAAKIYLSYTEEEITAIARANSLLEIAEPSKGGRYGKSV
jgi:hypothetical protein